MSENDNFPLKIFIPIASVTITVASLYYLFRPESPSPTVVEGGLSLSEEEKKPFIPSVDWQPVEDNHVCPPGLEYRLNMTDGSKLARLIS